MPYQGLGDPALDTFSALIVYMLLAGVCVVGLVMIWAVIMKFLQMIGAYKPTGPITTRMVRLIIFVVLCTSIICGVALFFYWFLLDPQSSMRPFF